MKVQLQKTLIDSIKRFTNLEQQQTPTGDTIGMIIGLSIAIVLIILFFIYLAYFFPWWGFYNLICVKCMEISCCFDCIICYYTCPVSLKIKKFKEIMNQSIFDSILNIYRILKVN